MYSGKIAVPPGGGGIVSLLLPILCYKTIILTIWSSVNLVIGIIFCYNFVLFSIGHF
jgi:hypothetical protein